MGIPDEDLVHPEHVPPSHRCLICQEVLLDPKECGCEVAFCAACIGDWLQRGKNECPNCRQYLSHETLKRAHRSVVAAINNLETRCRQPGCGWTGQLDARANHECQPKKIAELTARAAALEAQLGGKNERITELTERVDRKRKRVDELSGKLKESEEECTSAAEALAAIGSLVQQIQEVCHSKGLAARQSLGQSSSSSGESRSAAQAEPAPPSGKLEVFRRCPHCQEAMREVRVVEGTSQLHCDECLRPQRRTKTLCCLANHYDVCRTCMGQWAKGVREAGREPQLNIDLFADPH
mmetsp:Transcript_2315/g.4846  ORF Transcript_2315/g.4846 Transcript_2315/m.4846 type:complete len:295 (-) Transcript_2315:366-1250(-)